MARQLAAESLSPAALTLVKFKTSITFFKKVLQVSPNKTPLIPQTVVNLPIILVHTTQKELTCLYYVTRHGTQHRRNTKKNIHREM